MNTDVADSHIAVIGAGVAGTTAAVHFAELGYKVTLLEKGDGLVNGPPICHLHAGGNLYREISQQQCLELLQQSINSVRLYPCSINIRPTIIAVPCQDPGDPCELLPRLQTLQAAYQTLVERDARNRVLGEPKDYFKIYARAELEALAQLEQPAQPVTADEWCIPFAKHSDLENLKYPVVMVQEYGWSVFRLAAIGTLALAQFPKVAVMTGTELRSASRSDGQWQLEYQTATRQGVLNVDYLVNACGFETGQLDDQIQASRERLVEFKSAYVTRWQDCQQEWPEVIFHGQRGTPNGMAQLTPYGNGVFQLHGMTKDITLFEGGLVKSDGHSSQPQLPGQLARRIRHGWEPQALQTRTQNAINYMAHYIPDYQSAAPAGKPLFGAQQIPGSDPSLRSADVSFVEPNYARIEIVKASSTLQAAQKIAAHWFAVTPSDDIEASHPVTCQLDAAAITQCALHIASQRGFPKELAQVSGMKSETIRAE